MSKDKQLRVSEIFHSIQGEGNTMGKPSVFLRLQGCNLMCGGRGTEKDKELHDGATWRCDTIEVWLKGDKHSPMELADYLTDKYWKEFCNGSQLVITGGEPLLQQDLLPSLIRRMKTGRGEFNFRVEIETNGTIPPDSIMERLVDQFNISPKLTNSGMKESARIIESTMDKFSQLSRIGQAIFKFVVTRENDMQEIIDSYIHPFDLPVNKVWIMPGCSNREQFERVAPLTAKLCQEYGFHFSSRLQINLWNEVTGV